MSKLIPGNQKYLTLDDCLYMEHSLNEGRSLKDITKFLCKNPATVSKEIKLHRIQNTWNKGNFNNPYNFCIHRFRCKKQMHVGRLSSVILCAVPAINVSWCAPGLRRKPADDWTGLPLSVMAAPERKTCAPYQRSMITMLMLPSAITKNSFPLPGLVLISPDSKCTALMRLSLL